jgi:hypothetical protein
VLRCRNEGKCCEMSCFQAIFGPRKGWFYFFLILHCRTLLQRLHFHHRAAALQWGRTARSDSPKIR